MTDEELIGPAGVPGSWRIAQGVGAVPRGALDERQRARSAAAYEAARMILEEGADADEIVKVAQYIVTGRATVRIDVGPSEGLVQEVIERVSTMAADSLRRTGDAMNWSPRDVVPEPGDAGRG